MPGPFTITPSRAAITEDVSALLKPYFTVAETVNQSAFFMLGSGVTMPPGSSHHLAQFTVGPGGWIIQAKALVNNSDGAFLDLSARIDGAPATYDSAYTSTSGPVFAMIGLQVQGTAVIRANLYLDSQYIVLNQVCIAAIRQDAITTFSA